MKHVFLLAIASIASINISQANCVDFWNDGKVCININNAWWNSYQVSQSNSSYNVACDILTPDDVMTNVWWCNGIFQYMWNGTQSIKLYVKLGNQYKIGTFNYTFWWNWSVTNITTPSIIPSNRYSNTLTFGQSKSINDVIKLWPVLISTLKVRFPKLNTNTTWQSQSDILSIEMQKLVNGTTPRVYSNYKSFRDGLISFVQYTITQR